LVGHFEAKRRRLKWKAVHILRLERLLKERCDDIQELKADLERYTDKYRRLERENESLRWRAKQCEWREHEEWEERNRATLEKQTR